jgi:hypothetical protein
MNLKRNIIISGYLFGLLVFAFLLFGCVQSEKKKVFSESEVSAFVMEDLNSKYPNADVKEILEMKSSDSNESWEIKARVTFNYTSPCPVRMNVYYDYPRKGFVEKPPEYITRTCEVCQGVTTCILGTPEEAIIASHTLSGSDPVKSYLGSYSDAKASAKFYSDYIDPVEKKIYKDVWIVKWTSEKTNYGLIVLISNDAKILGIIQATKQETI